MSIQQKIQVIDRNQELLMLILPHLDYHPSKRASNGDYMCKCVFHNHNHPDEYKMNVGLNGWWCNSAGEGGELVQLAQHLRIDLSKYSSNQTYNAEKAFDYTDEKGNLLFQVVRLPGKKFRQRQMVNGEVKWNVKGVRKVPYRLRELTESENDNSTVFICEGEKDVDNVRKLGLIATCNPGGAGKWRKEYSKLLKGRNIVLLPDNDDPGRKHMETVARMSHGIAKTIKIVNLPGFKEKQDISDWLRKGNSVDDLLKLVDEAEEWEPSDLDVNDKDLSDAEKEKRESQANTILKHLLKSGIELFHDQREKPYIIIQTKNGQEVLSVDSKRFKTWLSNLVWQDFETALNGQVLKTIRTQFAGKAIHEGSLRELNVRYARNEESIWIDLDGHQAVKVTQTGHEIVTNPPALFKWFSHMKPLSTPEKNGDSWQITKFLNIQDSDSKLLLVCYLIAAMNPTIPIPALVFHGVKGSTKTTSLKVIKRILDPSRVLVRGTVPDQDGFSLAAWQNRVLFFDNLSSIPPWFSDACCRVITGEGWSKRTLYTDEDVTFFEYRGVIGLAGINCIVDKSDLLDRSIIIPLNSLTPKERRLESEFWGEFEDALPSILGGLYDTLSKTLAIVPTLKLPELPRMADFGLFGSAAAIALGKTSDDFLRAYNGNINRQNEAAIDASYVAQAVIELMKKEAHWKGSSTELLDELNQLTDGLRINRKSHKWPQDPSWLTRRLKEVEPNLQVIGINVEHERGNEGRKIVITVNEDLNSDGNCNLIEE